MTKKFIKYLTVFLFTSALIFTACEKEETIVGDSDSSRNNNQQEGVITTISGQVINSLTETPLDSTSVMVIGGEEVIIVVTDNQGKYSADIELISNTNVTLVAYRVGFRSDSTSVFATAGGNVNVPFIRLVPSNTGSGGSGPSGDPVSIFLQEQSTQFIGVKESGAEETARLTFVVQDSAGNPIDLEHSVDVHFVLGASPNGGEEITPAIVKTNSSGLASVNLTSGTKAGVVQIIAEITIGSKKITSLPVGISIHGGLPDNNHFSIAPNRLNFAGYNIYGLKNQITAYVGDKYGNPVRPQTSVYFTTTGGIIEGSTQTDNQGIGSVELISADPKPNHYLFGPGFATITASTADENKNTIKDSIVVLFSGVPQITVSPTSFNIPNGGSQSFTYTVSDQNGNPLVEGTNITVAVEGTEVDASGDLEIQMGDTQSKLATEFSFVVFDTADSTDVVKPLSITIKTDGENGRLSRTLTGTKR